MSGNDFDFGGSVNLQLSPSLEDGILNLDDTPDIFPELPENKSVDLVEFNAPIADKSDEYVLQQTEDTLLKLLYQNRRRDIQLLSGDIPDSFSEIPASARAEFSELYARAVNINPAIKWYSKLSKILSDTQFFYDSNGLCLSVPSKIFNSILKPFLLDFDPAFRDSPIVEVVLGVAEALRPNNSDIDSLLKRDTSGKKAEDGQFEIGSVDFDSEDPAETKTSEIRIDDDIFGQPHQIESDLKISLRDYSNKAVAEYCVQEGWPTSEVSDRLQDEGFTKAHANEIEGIVKYIKIENSLKARAKGNYGGDVNFTPR